MPDRRRLRRTGCRTGSRPTHRAGDRPAYRAESLERRLLLAADVVISEFMAKNTKTLKDNFGDYSDWVELHNRGDAPIDLGGWYLTDTTKTLADWKFPSPTTLSPGAYLVVYASGRNLAVAGQPLHTNFSLDANGEYLALVQPDGTTVQSQYAPTFPAQTADVSYGISNEDLPGSPLQFFSTPTPGARNQPSAAPVTFSAAGGGYTAPVSVTLSDATAGAQIRYTTNGTLPTATSTLYTGPITLSSDTMLRARAFATNFTASPVTSQQYFVLDSTTSSFHSNLPLVVIDTFGQGIGQTAQTPASVMIVPAPTDGTDATLSQSPNFVGRAGLDVRGQTSASFPKQQYHLEVWDENNNDRAASLLGMPADSDWVLYAPYSEKALMQNQLIYKWSNELGDYAVHTQWVEVFLNTGTGKQVNYAQDYVGVYLLMEKIKIGKDRVNITKVGPGDDTAPNVTGGYLWSKDKTDPDGSPGWTTSHGQTFQYVSPGGPDLDAAQKTYLTNYVNQFEAALYGPNFADPQTGYAAYIDVNSFVDNWILVEMAKNIDGFRLSTYYYKDRNGKIVMGPIWDYNLSMGNANYNTGDQPTGWYHSILSNQDYTYFDRLTQDPAFMRAIATRWQQLRQTVFSTPQITADINANVQVLTDGNGNIPSGQNPTQAPNNPVVRNFEKWHILATSVWPNSYVGNSWTDEVNHLTGFMTTRVAWMDQQLAAIAPTTPPGTPGTLTATPFSDTKVFLSWKQSSGTLSGYQVEQSADGGKTWTATKLSGTAASFLVAGLSAGKAYQFRVSGYNSAGTSAASNVVTATTNLYPPVLDYSTGFNSAGGSITRNGSATVNPSGSNLILTNGFTNQTASAFSASTVGTAHFTSVFTLQDQAAQGEGLTFTLQNVSPNALGAAGPGLGSGGLANSVAVKFDLYDDGGGEGANSTGLFVGGDTPTVPGGSGANPADVTLDMTPSGVSLHNGDQLLVVLQYDGAALSETVTDTVTGSTFSHTYAVNIPAILGAGSANAGFTASTGAADVVSTQQVLNWTYTVPPPPAPTGVAAAVASNNSAIQLNWAAGPVDTFYNVYRGTSPGGEGATPVATGLTDPTFTDAAVTAGQTYYYKVTALDAGGEGAASTEVSAALVAPAQPPTLTVNDGSAQRSTVTSLTLKFSSPVSLQSGAVTLAQRPTGDGPSVLVPVSVSNPSGDGTTWLVTFTGASGPDLEFGSLPDGTYDLTVSASLVSNAPGAPAGSPPPLSADATFTFHRLFGDSDGNQTVNAADYARFKNAFGSGTGASGYNVAFDFDGNGTVNALDYAQFKKRFGTTFTY